MCEVVTCLMRVVFNLSADLSGSTSSSVGAEKSWHEAVPVVAGV